MSLDFPVNTIVLIVSVMTGVALGSWLIVSGALNRVTAPTSVKRAWRVSAAIFIGGWFALRLVLALVAQDGAFQSAPYLVASLVVGMTVGLLPLLISPFFRRLIRSVPETWLIGIHAIRIGGFLFLALLDMRRLPAGFALPAGYGDVTVGVLSLFIVYALVTGKSYVRALVIGWNLLGLLDFIVALGTGITFITPFATQLAASGVSLSYLNFVFFVPSFGVPLFALLHFYSLYQTMTGRAEQIPDERQPLSTGSPIISSQL